MVPAGVTRFQARIPTGLADVVSLHSGSADSLPAGVMVALKNGWLPLDARNFDWQINSVGWVSGDGRDYLIAVFTTGNPTEQYGIDTIDALAAMVWQRMA